VARRRAPRRGDCAEGPRPAVAPARIWRRPPRRQPLANAHGCLSRFGRPVPAHASGANGACCAFPSASARRIGTRRSAVTFPGVGRRRCTVSELDYQAFDADNHFYEAAPTPSPRHLDPRLGPRTIQWCEINAAGTRDRGRVSHAVEPHVQSDRQARRVARLLPRQPRGQEPARDARRT